MSDQLALEYKKQQANSNRTFGMYQTANTKVDGTFNTTDEKETQMETLYQFTKATVEPEVFYGKKLAEDSLGNWIMEVKGNGQVVQVNPDLVTEVMPYTVGLTYQKSGTVYHYKAKTGEVELGYYLANFVNNSFVIVEVVELDTKSKKATKDTSEVLLKKL